MRREESNNDSVIPVFHAPLSENLTDIISGVEGSLRGPAGAFSEDGYSFGGSTVIVWNTGFWNTITFSTPFTFMFDYKKTGQSGHSSMITTGNYPSYTEQGIYAMCNASTPNVLSIGFRKDGTLRYTTYANSGVQGTKHLKTGFTYDGNGTLTRIQDGTITGSTTAVTQAQFPDFTHCILTLGGLNNYSSDRLYGYLANVMFFDTVLEQKQIDRL